MAERLIGSNAVTTVGLGRSAWRAPMLRTKPASAAATVSGYDTEHTRRQIPGPQPESFARTTAGASCSPVQGRAPFDPAPEQIIICGQVARHSLGLLVTFGCDHRLAVISCTMPQRRSTMTGNPALSPLAAPATASWDFTADRDPQSHLAVTRPAAEFQQPKPAVRIGWSGEGPMLPSSSRVIFGGRLHARTLHRWRGLAFARRDGR
jgi:hypothetical protein